MIEKLKKHFGKNVVVQNDELNLGEYCWYKTPDNITVGFPADQISEEERSLLNIFLSPITNTKSYELKSNEEKFWYSILFDTDSNQQIDNSIRLFHFIHFNLKGELSDPESFADAIKSLLPSETVILWESETQGVIIDLEPDITEQIENLLESITDTIISDFYIDLSLFTGIKTSDINEAKNRYYWEKTCFEKVRHLIKKKVYHGEESIPYLLLYETSSQTLHQISEQLLQNVMNEKDLIKSIRVYLDCNMNISHAAKKLFLHRNTLQYRVEKFIEKTGIDIRHFSNAASIYLALLIHDSSK
jgi:DNA-binding PucR family transcriptional regulator